MRKMFAVAILIWIGPLAGIVNAGAGISFTNLRFTADSTGGQGVFARVNYYCADSAWDGETVTLVRTGNTLTATIPNSSNIICFGTPAPPADIDVALGTLPAGDYQFVMQEAPLTQGGKAIPLIAGPFTVGAAAAAPYTNLRIIPNPGQTGTPIEARVLFTCNNGFGDGQPIITRHGQLVLYQTTVVLDPCFAGVPPPPQDIDLPIGQFTPGNYTMVLLQQPTASNIVFPALTAPFVIQGSAQSVPVDAPWGLILLTAMLLILGSFWYRHNASN